MKERIKIIWFIRKWNLWKFIKNTINQEKIGTFDNINIYKMEYMLDEEKNFINKNRDIYNSGKRTYRIIIESNGKVIEVFIEFNPKSIQRIIQLMGWY